MKMFSIDRVFRNEAVDATHLAEFHQVEGVVADYGLTLADLIGMHRIPRVGSQSPLQSPLNRFYANLLQKDGNRKLAL